MKQRIDTQLIVAKIKEILPKQNFVALHEPVFAGNEWAYVKECIDTAWVSSVGKYVDQFEHDLAEYTGSKCAVAVVNGTAALHISLILAGVRPNDEVLMPAITFIATANAVSYCSAVPHFVDSEMVTLGIDAEKLRAYLLDIAEMHNGECYNKSTQRRIKAIVPMHTFGHPVDLDALLSVCEEFGLVLVEDAAESLGSYYKGRHTGNIGLISAFSFNGNKTITTGGGGAIVTNNEELGKLAKHITTTAKVPHKWEFYHDMVAYNYRMPNINAALGVAQLEQLDGFLAKKRLLAEKYKQLFSNVKGITFVCEPEFTSSNYWLNAIMLDKDYEWQRGELLEMTNSNGVMTRPVWNLMYTLPMYSNCPKMDCHIAEGISKRLINLPSGVGIMNHE